MKIKEKIKNIFVFFFFVFFVAFIEKEREKKKRKEEKKRHDNEKLDELSLELISWLTDTRIVIKLISKWNVSYINKCWRAT